MKLWRRDFITRLLAASAALAASKRSILSSAFAGASTLSTGDQVEYTMELLSLLHAAREIQAGRGSQLASWIEQNTSDHIASMLNFDESNLTIATHYLAGVVLQSANQPVPSNVAAALKLGREKVNQVLSAGCFDLTACKAAGCVPWPTSLRPANVNAPNPMGWHYIVGSHCGFSWPKFWKLDCGPPIALKPCTGDENETVNAALTLSETSAVAVPPQKPNRDGQNKFAMQVLSLLHIAREIRAGRGPQFAASIGSNLGDVLTPMLTFRQNNLTIAVFYLADRYYGSSGSAIPTNLGPALKAGSAKVNQILSQDCFDLTVCKSPGCAPWPTSLRPANVNAPSPIGWRYIVGSHCGFSWPKFWKLDCGQPLALEPCTGSEQTSSIITPEEQTFVPRTSDPGGYIVGTVVDPNSTGPTGFVYSTVDEQGKTTSHKGTTDKAKRFAIFVPVGIALIEVARRLDAHGNPYKPAQCMVGHNLPISGLRSLSKPPSGQPAIIGGNSSWDRSKPIEFQTRGIDPRIVRMQIDGSGNEQQILAASNSSVIAHAQTTPGTHTVTFVSGGKATNGVPCDFVDAAVTLTGSNSTGGTKVATLQVTGVPPEHPAECTFTVSGASQFAGGRSELTVPLVNGRATANLQNVRSGETLMRWELTVKIPGVWD
ncbi:MAG TPA: hypothetical protein VIW73_09950 [Candidatus Cybelea sp.]